jgi:hypothetical protein
MFKLRIETKNAAFFEDDEWRPEEEIKRILEEVIKNVDGDIDGVIHDFFGNRVGEWKLTKR